MRPPKKKVLPTNDEVENIESIELENTETTTVVEEIKEPIEEKAKFSLKSNAPLIKKGIKIIIAGTFATIAIYKLFLQADPMPTQDAIDQGVIQAPPKPSTPKDFANQSIPLTGKQNGEIVAPKINANKNNLPPKSPTNTNNNALELKEVPLEAPDLPQLPDFNPKSSEDKQTIAGIKPPSIDIITKKSYKTPNATNSQDPNDPDNPSQPKDPNAPQPLDLQNVTRGGIPIINSNDLTLEEKRRITMFAIKGSGPSDSGASNKGGQKSDIIIADGSSLSLKKANSNVNAEQVQNLDTTLIQGKMISATLENAINSQLPGNIRGIVNTDVYGESGNKILIPRGTRIYGAYNSSVANGQSRITILWNRIIRPDGVSVSINAQATDQFGRAGIEGDLDNRFSDNLANTLLITFASLGTAVALSQLSGSSANSTVAMTNGGTSVTSNPLNTAATAAIQTWQNMANQLNANPLPPVITLPHGTKIKVMVAQDITLPEFRKVRMP